jgi:hypothetical protein
MSDEFAIAPIRFTIRQMFWWTNFAALLCALFTLPTFWPLIAFVGMTALLAQKGLMRDPAT